MTLFFNALKPGGCAGLFLLKKSDKIIVPEEFMVYIFTKCGILRRIEQY